MDISKLVLRDPLEKQVTQASSSSLPKGTVGQVLFSFCSDPFLGLKVKYFFPFDIIHSILLSREAVAPPRVCSFSVTTQTESSLPPLPVKSHSLSSSFVR